MDIISIKQDLFKTGPYNRVYIKALVCKPGYPGLPTTGHPGGRQRKILLLVTPGVGNPGCRRIVVGNPGCW